MFSCSLLAFLLVAWIVLGFNRRPRWGWRFGVRNMTDIMLPFCDLLVISVFGVRIMELALSNICYQ